MEDIVNPFPVMILALVSVADFHIILDISPRHTNDLKQVDLDLSDTLYQAFLHVLQVAEKSTHLRLIIVIMDFIEGKAKNFNISMGIEDTS